MRLLQPPSSPVDGTSENDAVIKPPEVLLSSVKINATSRILGLFWFILTYLFLPDTPQLLIPVLLTIGVFTWITWEVYWARKWHEQDRLALAMVKGLEDCLASQGVVKPAMLPRALEIMKQIQNLAGEVANTTMHTPLR